MKDEMIKIGRRYAARSLACSPHSPLAAPLYGRPVAKERDALGRPPCPLRRRARRWRLGVAGRPRVPPVSPSLGEQRSGPAHTLHTLSPSSRPDTLATRALACPWPPVPFLGAPTPPLPWDGGWVVEIRHRRGGGGRSCREHVHRSGFRGLLMRLETILGGNRRKVRSGPVTHDC